MESVRNVKRFELDLDGQAIATKIGMVLNSTNITKYEEAAALFITFCLPKYEVTFVENGDEDTINANLSANTEDYSYYTKQTHPAKFEANIYILENIKNKILHVMFSASKTIPKGLVFTFSF